MRHVHLMFDRMMISFAGLGAVEQPEKDLVDATLSEPVALFTLILVVATIGLWLSTSLLWWTTRRIALDAEESGKSQAEKMERSASAMERVAESMATNAEQIVQSVELQSRFGRMQLRPYLTVLIGEGLWQTEHLRFEIRPRVLNTGHTPARDVQWRIGVEVLTPESAGTFRFPLPPKVGGNMIAPHQDYLLTAILDRRIDDDADEIRDGNPAKGIIIVYGCVSYRDNMTRRYLTTFAQQVWWDIAKGWRGKIKNSRLRGRFLYKHNRAN